MADVPGLTADQSWLERVGAQLDVALQGTRWGSDMALATIDRQTANAAMLARNVMAFAQSGAVPGLSGASDFENLYRSRADAFQRQAELVRGVLPPGAAREVGGFVGGLPLNTLESIAANRAGGPVGGMALQRLLSSADQGPVPALEETVKGGIQGLIFKGVEPYNPVVRAGAVGGSTLLLDRTGDPTVDATNATANAIMAGLPLPARASVLRSEEPAPAPKPSGRIPVEGLPAATPDAPLRIEGVSDTIPAAYALVEASTLKPSHDAVTFSPRADYGAVQERDYHVSKNEQSKVVAMADNLDTRELLNRAPNANTGPAVVDPNGNVWGGNGRTMAQERVWRGQAKTTPDQLRQAIIDAAPTFGLDPQAAAGMREPAIVRVLGPDSIPPTREGGLVLSRLLNVETTHAATPAARAQSNAAALDRALTVFADAAHTTGEDIGTIRSVIGEGQTARRFAEALQQDGVIPTSERARWLTAEGTLTKQGLDQAEQMLLARVLPDQNLVESIPGDLREKVLRNVPAILSVEAAAPGTVGPLIADTVRSEIARAATAKGGKKLSVDEFNRQLTLDPTQAAPSQRDPRVAAVQRLFSEKNATQLRSIFKSMNARVGAAAAGQADLLSGKVASPQQAINDVLESVAPGSTAAAPELASAPAPPEQAGPDLFGARPVAPPQAPAAAAAPPPPEPMQAAVAAPAPAAEPPAPAPTAPPRARAVRAKKAVTPPPAEPPPPEPPAAASPPPPPPEPPRPPAPKLTPEQMLEQKAQPPVGPAEFYRRLAVKRGKDVIRAKELAGQAARDLQAPFRMEEGTPLPRPVERRVEETRAVLDEIYRRRGDANPEAAVDDMLRRTDLTIGDHADVIMPTIARFYRDHAWIAKRGVVPDVEVRRLANALGLSERQMMRKMVGEVPNAETVVAMRQLVESRLGRVNDLVDKLADPATATPRLETQFALEHKILGLLWAQFRGAKGELGRALRATQVLADAERPGVRKLTLGDLPKLFDSTHGGEQNVKLLIDKIRNLRSAPTKQAAFALRSQKATTWEKIMTAWRAALMSGGPTVARNLFGNTILQPMYLAARAAGTVAGRALDVLPVERIKVGKLIDIGVRTGAPKAELGQAYYEAAGMLGAGRAAAKLWRDTLIGPPPEGGYTPGKILKGAFLENRPPIEDPSVARRQVFENQKLDALVATPFRINEAFDIGARYPATIGRLGALASREAARQGITEPARVAEFVNDFTADPPEWAWNEAYKHAQRQTLNEDLGEKGRAVVNAVARIKGLQVLAPFLKIPINLGREIGRYHPAAGMFMSDVREQLAAGGAARDEAIGKMMVGSAISGLTVYLGSQGAITGSGPSDPAKRKLWMENHRPYSFNVGGRYYSYRGFEPLSSIIAIHADLGEKWHELSKSQQELTPGLVIASTVRNIDDIPVMTGVSDALESVLSGEPRQIDRWLTKTATSFVVPKVTQAGVAGARLLARTAVQAGDDPRFRPDPYLREAGNVMDSIMQSTGLGNLAAPGRDRAAPPKTGFWGMPLEKDPVLGPTYLSPFRYFDPKQDKVTDELYRLVDRGAMAVPGDVDRTLGGVRLEDWPYYEMKRAARGRAHAMLDQIVDSPAWQQIDSMKDENVRDFVKASIFDEVFRGANAIARAQMRGSLQEGDQLRSVLNQRLEHLLVPAVEGR